MNLVELLNNDELSRAEIIHLLNLSAPDEVEALFRKADAVRSERCGEEVRIDGIVEISNYCNQNCFYCSLREDNFSLERYRMSPDEIIETAKLVHKLGVNSILLQSGEDHWFDTDMIAYIIYSIKRRFNLSVTLSLGERGFDEYRHWKIAGAERYLLKHETANPKLYSIYHQKQRLEERIAHLKFLRTIGYEIGSGNIIGLPMQTAEDIADDILLCKELGVKLASFGPFIPSLNTPYQLKRPGSVELTLKTMAVARLVLKDADIPATTALATLDGSGRVKGLNAGANLVMPDFTPNPYKGQFRIFPEWRATEWNNDNYRVNLQSQIEEIGKRIASSRDDSVKLSPREIINWSFK